MPPIHDGYRAAPLPPARPFSPIQSPANSWLGLQVRPNNSRWAQAWALRAAAASEPPASATTQEISPGLREHPANRSVWRGDSIRTDRTGTYDRTGGGYVWDSSVQYSSHSANGTLTLTHGSAEASPPDHGGFSPEFNLYEWNDSAEVNVFDKQLVDGEHLSIGVSALGAEAEAAAALGFSADGVQAEAQASAGVYAVKVEASVQAGPLAASGEAQVGAEVEAAAELQVNPLNGDANIAFEAGGFAGARAEGEVSVGAGPAEAAARGDVGVGIGGDVRADVGVDDWTVQIDLGLHGYLGIGGGGEVALEIDARELAGDVIEIGGDAVELGDKAFDKVTEFGNDVGDKMADLGGGVADGAKKAWDKVTPW